MVLGQDIVLTDKKLALNLTRKLQLWQVLRFNTIHPLFENHTNVDLHIFLKKLALILSTTHYLWYI